MTEPTRPTDPVEPTGVDGPGGDDEPDEALRRLLRDLPEVEPPDGFFDGLIRTRRRKARAVVVSGLVAAGVVGALVVAEATGITGDADPEMDALAARHATMMTSEVEDGAMDDMPAPYQVPERLGPLQPGAAMLHDDDVVQIVYGGDGRYVSVFEEPGDFEDEAMELELTPLRVEGVSAWRAEDGSIVVHRRDVLYVLVGDVDTDDVADIVADLPDARPLGLGDRLRDAMDDLVDAFGLS